MTADTTIDLREPVWTVGDRIAKARRHAGLSQAELAALVGVHQRVLSRWERDEREPRLSQAVAIASVCHVPAAWLLPQSVLRTSTFAAVAA